MSDHSIAAVRERHGITTVQHGEWSAVFHHADGRAYVEYGPTEADAIVALLKARHGITTRYAPGLDWPWHAETGSTVNDIDASRDTELAAVVALADRLAGLESPR